MLFSTVVLTSVLGLVSSTIAAPTTAAKANDGAPFKIGITTRGRTLYLTEGETASEDISKGVVCTLKNQAIACGSKQLGYTYGDMHTALPMVPDVQPGSKNNKRWFIGDNNVISWKTKSNKEVHFSTKIRSGNRIYAEICSTYGHPDKIAFTPGTAKAYFVQPTAPAPPTETAPAGAAPAQTSPAPASSGMGMDMDGM